jgi:hypothetical protein
MLVARRRRAALLLALASGVLVAACGAFNGTDSSDDTTGSDGGARDVAPAALDGATANDASAFDGSVTSADGSAPTTEGGVDAGADACVLHTYTPSADTYFTDTSGGAFCNASTSEGTNTALHVRSASPPETIAVRFKLNTGEGAAFAGSTAVLTFYGATCTGSCNGSVHPMRSDWDEGTGGSDGADFCRRNFLSAGWGDGGAMVRISSPADYGVSVAAMAFDGTTSRWSSGDIAWNDLNAQLMNDQISFFLDKSGADELVASSRESSNAPAKPTLVVRTCK